MHKYTVEFRIEGQGLVPLDVTRTLGLQPCQIREETIGRNGNKRSKSLWSYDGFFSGSGSGSDSKQEWDSLEDGISSLLEILLPKRDLIRSKFGKFDMYWWCGHFQQSFDGGPTFSPELFKKLADFGIQLILDNYFSTVSESNTE